MYRRIGLSLLFIAAMLFAAALPAFAQADDPGTDDERPLLGVRFEDLDGEASITEVLTGSPAEEAGLQVDDVIVAISDEPVSTDELTDRVQSFAPGDTITVTVRRGDETTDVEVTLGSRPRATRERFMLGNQAFLGVTLQEQDGQVAIESVVDDGPAATAGLQAGDIITALNDEEVTSVDNVINFVNEMSPGDTLSVEVERNGETQSFDVELGTRPGDRGLSNIFIGGDEVEFNEEDSSWEVVEVQEGSILSEAGLMAGDVITTIDGEAFTPDQMPQMLQPIDPNATVALTVQRGDETLELEAPSTIRIALMLASGGMMFERGDRPFEFTIPPMRGNPPLGLRFDRPVRLGVAFVNLNETTAAEHETDVTEGALITEILADSPAEAAGLMVGDVISAVDGDIVDEERTLADRMVAYEAGDTITLDVLRDGETMQVDVTLEEVVMTPPQAPEATAEPDI